MDLISKAIMVATFLIMAPAAMAQPAGLPVPPEVPDGSTLVLFGPHWGQKATVTGGLVPTPPPGAYGNFQLPNGSWYPVSVTPPGWVGTILAGKCQQSTCPAGEIRADTYALIAP